MSGSGHKGERVILTRAERVAAAKAELERHRAAHEAWDEARIELKRAEESFDVGTWVHVEETCKRGCCIEYTFHGVIEAVWSAGVYYDIRSCDGVLHEKQYRGNMHARER